MGLLRNKSVGVGRLIFLVVLVCVLSRSGIGGTITVKADGSGDYATVQAAIDAASGGDEVVLEPGTYKGWGNCGIDYRGKAITVRSTEPNNPEVVSATIIDCLASPYIRIRGFYFHSGEGPDSILAGVTITNGVAPIIQDEWPSLMYYSPGGGIFCDGSSPTITNCRIVGNKASYTGSYGGGLGGGICGRNDSAPIISCCTITGNSAYGTWGGVGGGLHGCQGPIINCIIRGNSATGTSFEGSGGGISACRGPISNCTITDNHADDFGGGIRLGYLYDSTISNCILYGNEAENGPQAALVSAPILPVVTFSYNDIEGGEDAIYVASGSTLNWGEGNIDAEVLLTNDGHLLAGSVCIDAGDPDYSVIGAEDIDGESRVYGGRIDIGADEFIDSDGDGLPDWWEELYFGDATGGEPDEDSDGDGADNLTEYYQSRNPVRSPFYYVNPDEGDDAWDGRSAEWDGVHGPKATIQAAIDAASGFEHDIIILAAGTYTGEGNRDVDFKGKAVTVRSSDPEDGDVVAATVIDCEASSTDKHRGFKFISGEGADSVLAGVTITGGIGPEEELEGQDVYAGCAVFCKGSSPTIRNCVMVENKVYGHYNGTVFTAFGSPTITNCTIRDNLSSGIVCWLIEGEDAGNPVISDCVISGNRIGVFCCNEYSYEAFNGSPSIINCVIKKNTNGGIYGTSGLVKDCIITGNSSTWQGGGILCCNATITGCVISNNSCEDDDGGGIYSGTDIGPTITDCTISGNFASRSGGGVCLYKGAISGCVITGNIAEYSGGGISGYHGYDGYASITNCIISGNLITREGGGSIAGCHGPITNCTIVGNQALGRDSRPSGLYGCNGPVTNCIIRDNWPGQVSWDVEVTYSNVEGGWEGEGNIDEDALFAMEGDYHLLAGSACIDAGTNDPCGGLASSDMDGAFRPVDGDGDGEAVADMGAYEFSLYSPSIAVSPGSLYFVQNHPAPKPQVLKIRNCGGEALHWEIMEDCEWLEVSDDNGVCTDDINEVVVTVDSNGLEPGLYRYELCISDVNASNSPVCVRVMMPVGVMREVPSAEYATIQSAMDAAEDYDVVVVADGVYTGEGNRDLDFKGKVITVCSENGPESCIIDGEGSGRHGFYLRSEEREDSVIDGLTITNCGCGLSRLYGGSSPTINNCVITDNSGTGIVHVDGRPPTYRYSINISNCSITENGGGGIICERGKITGCRINDNETEHLDHRAGIYAWLVEIGDCEVTGNKGTGIRCGGGYSRIRDCVVSGNFAGWEYGGGINCGAAEIRNCVVSNNTSNHIAGGISCSVEATIDNCTVSGNSADFVGGICFDDSRRGAEVVNSIITGNSARYRVGGVFMSLDDGEAIIRDCVISSNRADEGDGGITFSESGVAKMINCTVTGNIAGGYGGGVSRFSGTNLTVENSIIRDNYSPEDPQIFIQGSGQVTVNYSNVEGGEDGINVPEDCTLNWGEGNISLDAGFAIPGDYHIMAGSPCVDAGDPNYSFDSDGNDVEGNPRLVDGDGDGEAIIDMGAYEYSSATTSMAVAPLLLEIYCYDGWVEPESPAVLLIRRCGGGTVSWEIAEDCNWLDVWPSSGTSRGEVDEAEIILDVNGLERGDYGAILTVTDPNASNGEVDVFVELHVRSLMEVPGEYDTIQAAIDDANDEDLVLVGDGVYTGEGNRDLDFRGKAITVRSENGAENCIVDCEGERDHRGFYFHNEEDRHSVLSGFTIRNGCSYSEGGGGGIYCYYSSPTIRDCIITANIGGGRPAYGGGIELRRSSPEIINCLISGNSAGPYGYGGGIYCHVYSNPKISNCTIVGNGNKTGRRGGGIHCSWSSEVTLNNCIVRDNKSTEGPQIYPDDVNIVSYSDVEGGWEGEGNIDAEPCFLDSGYWDSNNTPDDVNDDFWVDGDYHLLEGSPCRNTGDPDYTIRLFDADMDGNQRVNEGRIDMGVYEFYYPPIEVKMKFTPAMLNCGSSGNWVEAHFVLPEGYLPEDVDVNTPAVAEPVGAVSEAIEVLDEGDGNYGIVAVFDREAFCEALGGDEEKELEVTVKGSFTNGVVFYGTDTIRLVSDHWRHRHR